MSVETVVAEVEKAVEGTVAAAEGEVKTVAEAVVADTKAEVAKVEPEVKKALVQISTEEKLILREAELEYLKATMEIQRLSKITEAKSKEYQSVVESLFKKYAITKLEYVFDGAVNAFRALEKKL
jgi:hypothetical protein